MEIVSYRLLKQQHSTSAFNGEGARLYGGRWNSPGVPLVYTSESLALCCLEIFVHLPSYDLLRDYVYIQVRFDSSFVEDAQLVDGWDARPVSQASQSIGDQWVERNTSPILRVPSVIIPEGSNYLINISHPDFKEIEIGKSESMAFDQRLHKF